MRGQVIQYVKKASELLKITDKELENNYYIQQTNMQGQVVGSMNAFVKKVGGSIIGIDNSLRSMAEKLDSKNSFKDLRKMIEEYNNLEKLIK